MALSQIRTKIDTALGTIDGLQHAKQLSSVINPPFAFPGLRPTDAADYDFTVKNTSLVYHMYVEVLVNKGATIEQAQDDLDVYILPVGSSSIKTAIENISWGTTADCCRIMNITNYGSATYGGVEYLGARLSLDIWVSS